jgi:Protein of unknown function (DUF3108)
VLSAILKYVKCFFEDNMGTPHILYKILLLFCLTCINLSAGSAWAKAPVAPAPAEKSATPLPTPITFIGQYSFSWAGIYLGKLAFSIDEKPDSYTLRLQVTSGGIINLFTRHSNDTDAKGLRGKTHYQPQHYESHYKTKKKPRHIRLAFDAKGVVTEELNEPPENRAIRPEVPHELKDGSYDPLSGFMAIRSGLFTLTAFDVKRLYQVKAEEKGKSRMNILGADTPVQHYILSRTPLAGMTEKETKEYKAGEPPLHFYFSDPFSWAA